MKYNLILIIILFPLYISSQNPEIKAYVDYLKKTEKKTAKDYILRKFEKNDVVVLCERDHSEFSQYELIEDIISDNYFKKNVINLFTEIGVINLQPEITEFLKTRGLDSVLIEKKLNEIQQNASFWFIWERKNYNYLLKTIYNQNNNSDDQISYFPSDVEFDWKKVNTVEEYIREQEYEIEPRDSLIAYNIINRYEKIKTQDNKKALIILNYRHAFKVHTTNSNGELIKNTAKYLTDYFGDRLASILLNRPAFIPKEGRYVYKLIQKGKWDAAFKYLDLENIGFDLKGSVFGNDSFDLWNNKSNLNYQDVFDGFVFYNTVENHDLIDFYNGLVPKDFEKEFFRRYKIHLEYIENPSMIKKMEDNDFIKRFIQEVNTERKRKYPNLKSLIESREVFLLN